MVSSSLRHLQPWWRCGKVGNIDIEELIVEASGTIVAQYSAFRLCLEKMKI